jgi:tryptophanyl-tRNA synthetase
LKNWVLLQNSAPLNVEIIYSIVDLHAMTVPYRPEELRANREDMWAVMYAVGIDMRRCIVFEQSAVPEHAELNWILGTLAPMGQLNRMTQWKV